MSRHSYHFNLFDDEGFIDGIGIERGGTGGIDGSCINGGFINDAA